MIEAFFRVIGRGAMACADEPPLMWATIFCIGMFAWSTVKLLRG